MEPLFSLLLPHSEQPRDQYLSRQHIPSPIYSQLRGALPQRACLSGLPTRVFSINEEDGDIDRLSQRYESNQTPLLLLVSGSVNSETGLTDLSSQDKIEQETFKFAVYTPKSHLMGENAELKAKDWTLLQLAPRHDVFRSNPDSQTTGLFHRGSAETKHLAGFGDLTAPKSISLGFDQALKRGYFSHALSTTGPYIPNATRGPFEVYFELESLEVFEVCIVGEAGCSFKDLDSYGVVEVLG
jgi:hypothetical protein